MSKRFIVTEEEKLDIRKKYLMEEPDKRKFCHGGNVKNLDDLLGNDEMVDYVDGVKIRQGGVKGLIDKLELLKVLRALPKISDGGEHLSYEIMNQIKGFKPYNYFDEIKNECNGAMDKIIELYKENEHGEELVKDIEKVYAFNHLAPKAKEYLKHTIDFIKGH
jgi:hypothetical protein